MKCSTALNEDQNTTDDFVPCHSLATDDETFHYYRRQNISSSPFPRNKHMQMPKMKKVQD
jgi:hypothetical protein